MKECQAEGFIGYTCRGFLKEGCFLQDALNLESNRRRELSAFRNTAVRQEGCPKIDEVLLEIDRRIGLSSS